MTIANNLKVLRKQKGLLQKQVAAELDIGYSNYNKLEKGYRDISLNELIKVAKFYGLSLDELVSMDEQEVIEVEIENKPKNEQLELLEELDLEDKDIIYKLINTMLTKKRMKDLIENSTLTA